MRLDTGWRSMIEKLINLAPDVVTFWSDIGCPWATLALRTLRSAAAAHGRQLLVDHRCFPLELFNREPTPKSIVDAEIVAIGGCVPDVGWRLWTRPDSEYPVTTLPAMEAVQAAKRADVGGLVASDELDTALRQAFYGDSRCISILPEILAVAQDCEHVDAERLELELIQGCGRAEVYAQWQVARTDPVQGSPHLFTANGFAAHNPGAVYRWTTKPGLGFPRLETYDPSWAEDLFDAGHL